MREIVTENPQFISVFDQVRCDEPAQPVQPAGGEATGARHSPHPPRLQRALRDTYGTRRAGQLTFSQDQGQEQDQGHQDQGQDQRHQDQGHQNQELQDQGHQDKGQGP